MERIYPEPQFMDHAWRLWGFLDSMDVLFLCTLLACALAKWVDAGSEGTDCPCHKPKEDSGRRE